jgi:hypothetical protein
VVRTRSWVGSCGCLLFLRYAERREDGSLCVGKHRGSDRWLCLRSLSNAEVGNRSV